jgi:hypothetical protein
MLQHSILSKRKSLHASLFANFERISQKSPDAADAMLPVYQNGKLMVIGATLFSSCVISIGDSS